MKENFIKEIYLLLQAMIILKSFLLNLLYF